MTRQAHARERALPIVAVLVVLVVLVATRLPHLGTGPLDFDEGVYWLSMRSMRAGNPLFASVYSSQPPAFLLLTEPPWAWLGGSIAAGRAVMLAWSVLGVGAAAVVGWRLGGALVGVLTAALLTVDPRMTDQSVILQADGPATSLALLSLAAAALAVTTGSRRWSSVLAVAAGAAMALGVLTKLFDVGALPALALVLFGGRRRWTGLGLAAAGALGAAACVLLPVAAAWTQMWSQAIGLHVSTRSLYPGITLGFLEQFLHSEWPLVAVAALGTLAGRRSGAGVWGLGLAWTAGALAALVATRPVFAHHMVLVVPGLALLGAAGIAAAIAAIGGRLAGRERAAAGGLAAAAAAVAGAVLLQHSLARLTAPTDSALVARLAALTPAASLVLGDDQFDQALAARDAPPQFVDTSIVRLRGAGVTAASLEGLLSSDRRVCGVLFASGRLATVPGFEQWVAQEFAVHNSLPAGAMLDTRTACAP